MAELWQAVAMAGWMSRQGGAELFKERCCIYLSDLKCKSTHAAWLSAHQVAGPQLCRRLARQREIRCPRRLSCLRHQLSQKASTLPCGASPRQLVGHLVLQQARLSLSFSLPLICLLPGGSEPAQPSTPTAVGTLVSDAPVAPEASQASPASAASPASQELDSEKPAEPLPPAEVQVDQGTQQLALPPNPFTLFKVGDMELPIVDAAVMKNKSAYLNDTIFAKFKDMDTAANAAWMLLGCSTRQGYPDHMVHYAHTIRIRNLDASTALGAQDLYQRMMEWMAKRSATLAEASAEGLPWPFVAGVFCEFCRLLSETEDIPHHPFMMWMQIHKIHGKPSHHQVTQAATEGLQHCRMMLRQLEARLLFFPLISLV